MEPFYYNHMDKERQAVYRAMQQGLLSLADSFQIPRIDGHALSDIFFELRLDHPEIFWVSSFKYRYFADSPNLIFIPEYLFEKSKIKDHQKAMNARVEKLARPAAKLPELEKEKYIHDFICENIHYDKLKKPYSHEIIGPLGHGVGVCEGIAKSVKILCDALGIWCMIALCGNNPEKGIKYRHTWNIVKIGKTCYHLDATFDNSLGKCVETGGGISHSLITKPSSSSLYRIGYNVPSLTLKKPLLFWDISTNSSYPYFFSCCNNLSMRIFNIPFFICLTSLSVNFYLHNI